MLPRSRSARRLFSGIFLILLPVAAVFARRGTEKPWVPNCPAYRQFGSEEARATIVEFSDFQCPACAAAVPTMHEIEARYGSKVHIYYKHLPWSFHKWAMDAALSAECAGKQGKFWEMHDHLFSTQMDWEKSADATKQFVEFARSLHLNMPRFDQCRKDPATAAAIQADVQDAKDHWVNSTPTFFIDGRRLVAVQQLRIFGIDEIEKQLRR